MRFLSRPTRRVYAFNKDDLRRTQLNRLDLHFAGRNELGFYCAIPRPCLYVIAKTNSKHFLMRKILQ